MLCIHVNIATIRDDHKKNLNFALLSLVCSVSFFLHPHCAPRKHYPVLQYCMQTHKQTPTPTHLYTPNGTSRALSRPKTGPRTTGGPNAHPIRVVPGSPRWFPRAVPSADRYLDAHSGQHPGWNRQRGWRTRTRTRTPSPWHYRYLLQQY